MLSSLATEATPVLGALASVGQQLLGVRGLASLPATVKGSNAVDVLRVGSSAPTLVKLDDGPWGAQASIPTSHLPGVQDSRIALIREPFATACAAPLPLDATVGSLGDGKVAVNADLARADSRMVVDEYVLVGDNYRLASIGKDFLRHMKAENINMALVPDVRSAVSGASAFNAVTAVRSGVKQSSNRVLMVAPTAFGFNEQAAQDNHFMNSAEQAAQGSELTRAVLREFSRLYHELTEVAGVQVDLFQHNFDHNTPDACFPNNWFSTHPAGEAAGGVAKDTLVLYPMKCPNRAAERRPDIIGALRGGSSYHNVVDLTGFEPKGQYFEGTGVLVLDRVNGIAYVSLSERADRALAERWVNALGYKDLVTFTSTDATGGVVYHTNVMMFIGTDAAVVCGESIADDKERQHLFATLGKTHTIVDITREQMGALCGNGLEVEDGRGLPCFAMSTQAHNAFTPDQRKTMLRHVAALHHAPIDTLEHVGGGGVRCTLAEIF